MKYLLLFALACITSVLSMAQSGQDRDAVKKVIIAFQDDFNNGSFHSSAYTTNDWVHINPGGGMTRGRDAVLKEVKEVHQTFLKGVTMTIDSMIIRFITPTVAVANVINKMSHYELPAGVSHDNERQIKTYIIVKHKNSWLLSHDHNTVVQGSNTAVDTH
ncbi:MAG: YybH family protein [Candidatus Dadabacteria bacterium]